MQPTPLIPDFTFLEEVEAAGPFFISRCFQCRKCTNGCPVTFEMDIYPDQIIRLAQLGQKDEILRSKTIWICASCETCSTRCPNEVRIAEVMDYFKELAIREGVPVPQPQVLAFHKSFLENVKLTGRAFEGALIPMYLYRSGLLRGKLRKGTWRDELRLGIGLFKKRRLSILPKILKGRAEVRKILRYS